MEITVAGTEEAVVMVEGGAREVGEAEVVEALTFAHEGIREIVSFENRFVEGMGAEKRRLDAAEKNEALENDVRSFRPSTARRRLCWLEDPEKESRQAGPRGYRRESFPKPIRTPGPRSPRLSRSFSRTGSGKG